MIFTPKNPKLFNCEKCGFATGNIKDYNRHLSTRKHENTTKYNGFTPKNPKLFPCACGKAYPYRSSLYNHKKCCTFIIEKEIDKGTDKGAEKGLIKVFEKETDNIDYKKMFLSMINENK